MRKRDRIKSITPLIFVAMWTYLLSQMGISVEGGKSVVVVGIWAVLVLGSIIITDKGFDLFDKNDNEEDE
ncbi:hypothetical protein AXI76_gp122 [Pseudoalteromonas phage H101]|uniref:Uncharacterized protein n=1 Tax=Pseudoalteromonas phage H101 TaxID=1654919 RepID=A0A0H4IRV2_9CAUD|nr:hypothetical protein AXI76_gp122 [Pseudoalteromonas phage H101]AKO61023.1 hypothetical protein [Pseudoalteromonas phage H101]|tara:strand:- start:30199 stop:30408 length:210 start_codon:yes stop_codon:yes gene_type:complete